MRIQCLDFCPDLISDYLSICTVTGYYNPDRIPTFYPVLFFQFLLFFAPTYLLPQWLFPLWDRCIFHGSFSFPPPTNLPIPFHIFLSAAASILQDHPGISLIVHHQFSERQPVSSVLDHVLPGIFMTLSMSFSNSFCFCSVSLFIRFTSL